MKNKFNRKFLGVIIFLGFLFLLVTPVFAQGIVPCGHDKACTLCDLIVGIKKLFDYGIKIIAVITLACATFAGVMYIVSSGNEGTMESAKKFLSASLIGFAVVLGAWVMVNTTIKVLMPTKSDLGIGKTSWIDFGSIDCTSTTAGGSIQIIAGNNSTTELTTKVGEFYSSAGAFSVKGGSGNYEWSATGLPEGLTIDIATGIISGTPTTAGIYIITVTATDLGAKSVSVNSSVNIFFGAPAVFAAKGDSASMQFELVVAAFGTTATSCANGATDSPTCTTCPSGKTMNSGICSEAASVAINGTCSNPEDKFVEIKAIYSDHTTVAKRANISIDGQLKSEYGTWSGCLPEGNHTVHFGEMNDGQWGTLGDMGKIAANRGTIPADIPYCYEDDMINEHTGCGAKVQNMNLVKEFSSDAGESGTAWLARNLVYPDAVAPKDQVINVQAGKTNSVSGVYNEHDSYYAMYENGSKIVGNLPYVEASGSGSGTADGTTSWDGKKFIYRNKSGEFTYAFARVKSAPVAARTSWQFGEHWFNTGREMLTYHISTSHADIGPCFLDKETLATCWTTGEGYGDEQEEIKEICSPIVYGQWHPACSPNNLYVGEQQNNTHGIPVPVYTECRELTGSGCVCYHYSGYYCLNSGSVLIPPSTIRADTSYPEFRSIKLCEGNSYCKMVSGEAKCINPTAENKEIRTCINDYCEGINSKLTEVRNTNGRSNADLGVVCCDGNWAINTKESNWTSLCNGKTEGLQEGGWYKC